MRVAIRILAVCLVLMSLGVVVAAQPDQTAGTSDLTSAVSPDQSLADLSAGPLFEQCGVDGECPVPRNGTPRFCCQNCSTFEWYCSNLPCITCRSGGVATEPNQATGTPEGEPAPAAKTPDVEPAPAAETPEVPAPVSSEPSLTDQTSVDPLFEDCDVCPRGARFCCQNCSTLQWFCSKDPCIVC